MMSENDPIRDSADDAMLDELLAEARWPAADGQAESRLRMRWSMARRSERSAYRPLLAAAAVLVIACGIWFVVHQHGETQPKIAIGPAVVPAPTSTPFSVPIAKKADRPPLVRALGPAERLVLITDKQLAKQKPATPAHKPPVDPLASLRRLDNASLALLATQTQDATRRGDAIGLLLERNDLQSFLYFVLRPSTREQALSVLHAMPDPPIRALLAELDHQQVDYRLAAAKALGGLCDHGIDQALMTMVRQNDHRREAIAALLSCSDPHAKQMLSQVQAYASADEIRSVQHDLNKTF